MDCSNRKKWKCVTEKMTEKIGNSYLTVVTEKWTVVTEKWTVLTVTV